MTIKLRGKTYWIDVTIEGERHRVSAKTDSKREALSFEKDYTRRVLSGELGNTTTSNALSLSEAIRRMERTEWADSRSLSTHLTNIRVVAMIIGEDTKLKDITQKTIGDLKLQLMGKYSQPATVNRKMAALQRILRVAASEWGILDAVPLFSKLSENNKRERVLSQSEEVKVFNALYKRDEKGADYLMLLLYSGCRLSEPLSVTSSDIDWERGVFYVDHKTARFTGKRRPVLLNNQTETIMRKYFITDSKPFSNLTRHGIWKLWSKALADCGLDKEPLVVHSLRHTFATRLVNSGVPLYEVQKLLGHSDSKTTERYAKLELDTLSTAVKRLDKHNQP